MEDLPPLVPESTPSLDSDPDCPFCAIISNYPPISTSLLTSPKSASHLNPHVLDPPAFVLLSTPHVIAFLDVYPLTRGHILLCPRRHGVKIGDLTSQEGAEIGRLLPLLSRSLTRALLPDLTHHNIDYNIVQNNGPGAAQVVPHTHFHIIPRYPFEYRPPRIVSTGPMTAEYVTSNDKANRSPESYRTEQPKGMKATAILFGRGQRHYRDDEEAEDLVKVMRARVMEEWEREFGKSDGKEGDGDGVSGASFGGKVERERRNGDGERGGKL